MKVSSLVMSLLLSSPFFNTTSHAFNVTNITCDDLPVAVDTDIVFDAPLNLTHCPRQGSYFRIFNVANDTTIDCNGHYFSGFVHSVGFSMLGGGTIINCHLIEHEIGVQREEINTNSSTLIVNRSMFTDVKFVVFNKILPPITRDKNRTNKTTHKRDHITSLLRRTKNKTIN